MIPQRIRELATSQRVVAISAALAVVLLGMTMTLALSMLAQSRDLDRNVEVTGEIVNANVRTLGQLQRELLRMGIKLQDPTAATADIELQRAFVAQRMREAQLSYQLQTLGTEELLDEARRIADEWNDTISPLVESVIVIRDVDPAGAAQLVPQILDAISVVEVDVNNLVAKGEINRKNQAGHANNATIAMLHGARRLVIGLVVTFVGVLLLLIIAVVSYPKFHRQREAARSQLEALHAEAQTLSEVASHTSNLVVITDGNGQIEWVNDAFVEITGYRLEEVRGRRPGSFLQGPKTNPQTVAFMGERIRAGRGFTTEVLNYTRNGEPYWAAVEVRPVHDSAGVLTNFIAVQSDVTDAREAQAVLRRAKDAAVELAEEKAQFLASMSHEIRTPLNAVIGLTDLLLDSDLGPQQREYAQIAHNSGSLVLSTISNILTYSASDSGNVELETRPFSLRRISNRTLALFETQARDKDLTLAVDIDDSVPETVVGDQVRLQQVLVNLVGNAVKFTERGRVDVAIRSTTNVANPKMCTVHIDVTDTGIGIAPDLVNRLFQPFSQVDASTTRRYGGSGLGLAISQQLVGLMGGNIKLESKPDVGSRFSFEIRLPIGETPAAKPEPRQPAVVEPGSTGLDVLLVEDDEINQTVAKHMLTRQGHSVTVANDGIEGVAAVQARDFDIVFMDIQMPRMDGLAATQEIRTKLPAERQPVVVALTANALDGDRERFLDAGMDHYLSKPFRGEQLAETVRRALVTRDERRSELPALSAGPT